MKSIVRLLVSVFLIGAAADPALAKVKAKSHGAKKKAQHSSKSVALQGNTNDVVVYKGATLVPLAAEQAILIDYNTGKVLLEKHADVRMTPSSMTKMMTSYLIEEKIMKKQLSLEASFPVSEKAWRTGGSKMFVGLGQMVKLGDLLKGITIQSGNDASIVAAEGISGGEPQFVAEMNLKAKEIGLQSTQFKNSHGMPEEGHFSTVRDLAKLSSAIIRNHAQFYGIYAEKDFSHNGIKQGNRNPLLYDNLGCDGLKTGHTEAGGYGVAASCVDGEQRYILVINGLSSMQARADEARKLISWAKENFIGKVFYKKGEIVAKNISVKSGVKEAISLVAAEDVRALALRSEQNNIQTKAVYDPVVAPVKKNDVLGRVLVNMPNANFEVPLLASESSEKLGLIRRFFKAIGVS